MAPPAMKRRKTDHSPLNVEDDDVSFASFRDMDVEESGPEDVTNGQGVSDQADFEDDQRDGDVVHNGDIEEKGHNGDVESEAAGAREEDLHHAMAVVTEQQDRRNRKREMQQDHRKASSRSLIDVSSSAYVAATFKSNIFKLQVDELLSQIRPCHRAREEAATTALHELKKIIEQSTPRQPLAIEEAERRLLMSSKVAVPFPKPRPPRDTKYKVAYFRPANINVVGSYALQTYARSMEHLEIDMAVTMPLSLFQEKDYLNFRYFYKRAYYVACVATALKADHVEEYHLAFRDFRDDPLKPILVVSPPERARKSETSPSWQINIIPCVSADVFPKDRLVPSKTCVRLSDENTEPQPTPFYNASLRADMTMTSYLTLVHNAATSCSAFRDASLLGKTWLRQRGLGSNISAGGFGSFEWSAFVALLLPGGDTSTRSVLGEGYSSFQLFKATMQVLARKDMSTAALTIGRVEGVVVKPPGDGHPMLWDSSHSHNLLYKMSPWSYNLLRQEANTTLMTLGDSLDEGFDSTFILKCTNPLLRYDFVISMIASSVTEYGVKDRYGLENPYRKLFDILKGGLGDRVAIVNLIPQASADWELRSTRPDNISTSSMYVGVAVNADNVKRTVDRGPAAENKVEAAAFRTFWGDKAELRRFKDGSIHESLVWAAGNDMKSVLEQIVSHLLRHHFGEAAYQCLFFENGFGRFIKQANAAEAFNPKIEAYKLVEREIRGLEGLPMSVRQLMPADPQLRYSSIDPPWPLRVNKQEQFADVTIQFEGSTRWPDDLVAIQRTKIALLLKLSELMNDSLDAVITRIGLENERHDIRNQASLDIVYDSGPAFRLRIHHDRELTLLERILKDKSTTPASKETAAFALAKYKRDYVKAPAHTQAVAQLCNRHPALSGSIRLTKKWFASHLLSNHFADEVVELLVARTFVQPWPWQTPSSVQTGFLRTLYWLARWDWRADPLIVDLSSGELKQPDVQAIKTRFEAWRKLDPALNRVVLFAASNVDPDGTTWTDGRPGKVVVGRMSALARAACAEIEERALELEPASLFSSPLDDYDFAVQLDRSLVDGRKRKATTNGTTFKNLELESANDGSLIGFDPIQDFLHELEDLYGSAIVFFSGGSERPVLAGLWNPTCTAPRSWRVNLSYSTVAVTGRGDDGGMQAEINKDAILAEIGRLGGDMICNIVVKSR